MIFPSPVVWWHAGSLVTVIWNCLPPGRTRNSPFTRLPFQSLWHERKCLPTPVEYPYHLCLPSIHFCKAGLTKNDAFWQSPWSWELHSGHKIVYRTGSFDGRTSLTPHAVELSGAASCEKPSRGAGIAAPTCLETFKQLAHKAGFVRRLQRSLLQTSGDSQHDCITEGSPDSSIGVVERILLHLRPLFSVWQSSSVSAREVKVGACSIGL